MKNLTLTASALLSFMCASAQLTSEAISVEGVSRSYLLYLPEAYSGATLCLLSFASTVAQERPPNN